MLVLYLKESTKISRLRNRLAFTGPGIRFARCPVPRREVMTIAGRKTPVHVLLLL
jgi:hypothetical protein